MTKIGFTGTQDGMTPKQTIALWQQLSLISHLEFHHGDCIGADEEAHDIARLVGAKIVGHPPTNEVKRAFCYFDEEREPKEYIARNHDIVDETQLLIATPKSTVEEVRSGTWATVRYARKIGREVVILDP